MDLKIDINEILKDDNIFLKFILTIVAFFIFITPGFIALCLEQKDQILSIELTKLIFFSFALSLPLNFLGAITYLHPFKTLIELSRKSPFHGIVSVFLGGCLWGAFSGCIIYFIVHKFGAWLSENLSQEIFLQYIAVYFAEFSLFGFYFMMSATRLLKKIGYEK